MLYSYLKIVRFTIVVPDITFWKIKAMSPFEGVFHVILLMSVSLLGPVELVSRLAIKNVFVVPVFVIALIKPFAYVIVAELYVPSATGIVCPLVKMKFRVLYSKLFALVITGTLKIGPVASGKTTLLRTKLPVTTALDVESERDVLLPTPLYTGSGPDDKIVVSV